MAKTKKPALGKGLSALLENAETDVTSKQTGGQNSGTPKLVGSISKINIQEIEANPFQPRTNFEEAELKELAHSIKKHGIIQPVAVRKLGYDQYQLISGERRFRAAQIAGLKDIPAYIRVANDQAMLEMALVENIQRSELNAIEVAISFKRLLEECDLTQEELGDKVSKNRSTVTNYLRLLKLPPEIQVGIRNKQISMGHARALISIEDEDLQIKLYHKIIQEKLSVRAVEDLVRNASDAKGKSKKASESGTPKHLSEYANKLQSNFKTGIKIKQNTRGKGNIVIRFDNQNELERILGILGIDE